MKAETNFFMNGIYLILVLVVISLVLNRVASLQFASTQQEKEFELRDRSMLLLETLSNNVNCLAYRESGNIDNTVLNLTLHAILDKQKLNGFNSKFYDVQPDCARDFNYGYRVEIITLPINISSMETEFTKPNEQLNVSIPPMSWSFGNLEFSQKAASRESTSISIPIDVFFDSTMVLPGKMTITLVDGELEKIRGFIDKSCITGFDYQQSLTFHYPVSFEASNVCLEISNAKVCQKISCDKVVDFGGMSNAGTYDIYSKNKNNILKIVV
jgi:hypothetical protein